MMIEPRRFQFPWKMKLALNILIAGLVVTFGNLGLLFSDLNSSHAPLWSPAGVSLAALLVFGIYSALPGVILGNLILSSQVCPTPFIVMGGTFSNTLEPVLGAVLLFYYGRGKFKLNNLKDTVFFVIVASFLVPFVFCTTELAFFYRERLIAGKNFYDMWLSYYVGDVVSILFFTPLIASFFSLEKPKPRRYEGALLFILLSIVFYWALEGNPNKRFMIVPFLIWSSIRFSFRGVALGAILLSLIGIWRSTHLLGLFDSFPPGEDFFWIQCLSGGTALVGYFLGTVSEADERAKAKERESSVNLEHKRIAEEALTILDQSIKKSPIGFSLVDKSMRFIRVNEIMASLNGVTPDYHLGRSVREIIPELANELESKVRHVFATGESLLNIPMQGYSKSRPNELISGVQSYYPVKHPITDEVFGVAMTFQDLTEQKNTEQKLRVTEANLLHALSVRDEFVATASHELKTPLTSLRLQNELFQKGLKKENPLYLTKEKVTSILERNAKQIDRLSRLVDDMLDTSRIKTGKLTIKRETCNLNQILKDVLLRTKDQFVASGSGLPQVEFGENPIGDWDPLRIEQVITNLVTNAIRYGRGRPIELSIVSLDETVRFSIKDQGLGIPKSDQKKIFQRYERGLLAREISGLGLGLFICEQIVEAHKGMIWVESEVNQGATFFIELPYCFTQSENLSEELQEAHP